MQKAKGWLYLFFTSQCVAVFTLFEIMSGAASVPFAALALMTSATERQKFALWAFIALWLTVGSLSIRLFLLQKKEEEDQRSPRLTPRIATFTGMENGHRYVLEVHNTGEDMAQLVEVSLFAYSEDMDVCKVKTFSDEPSSTMEIGPNEPKSIPFEFEWHEILDPRIFLWEIRFKSARTGKDYGRMYHFQWDGKSPQMTEPPIDKRSRIDKRHSARS